MEIKSMKDEELANRMINYIERLEKLKNDVLSILDNKGKTDVLTIQSIKNEYKCLKTEIATDAHYVDLERNKKRGNNLYATVFTSSLLEASASGFRSAINSKIDFSFFSSINEAHYKLTKYYNLEEWIKIALTMNK